MIPKRDLQQLRAEWTLDIGVIEKDYILGWLLAGIARHPALAESWIFKGGTCLRKCYYETFRFSEDLDFTVTDGGPDEPDDLRRIFGEIADWLLEESGIVADARRPVVPAKTEPTRQTHHPGKNRLSRSEPSADVTQGEARHHHR